MILAVGTGAASAFTMTVHHAYIYDLVGRDHALNGLSLATVSHQIGSVIGGLSAGAIIVLFGVAEQYLVVAGLNVLALAVACREALGRFDRQKGGHIVNVSSMAGHRIPPGGGFYAATKFAVRAITECLRQEFRTLGSPSRVSEISPGFVSTEFHEVLYRGDAEKIAAGLPQYRVLDPGDVAASVVHILEAPDHVAIHDILLRSNEQES